MLRREPVLQLPPSLLVVCELVHVNSFSFHFGTAKVPKALLLLFRLHVKKDFVCKHQCTFHRPTPERTRVRTTFFGIPDSRRMRHSSHEGESTGASQPRQLRYLGYAAPLAASAVGDRSLMWPCHITGTPRCSTAIVHNQHSLV